MMGSPEDDARNTVVADPPHDLVDGGLGREGGAAEGSVVGGAHQIGPRGRPSRR
jgi:hypothetical protein